MERESTIRVIIVEDDPSVLDRFVSLISPCEDLLLVGHASNKTQGSELVQAGGYNVFVCDLGLPDGDGTDLVRQSAMSNPKADIMVLTMFADHQKVLAAIKAGARGYLLKDQSLDECVSAIREVFNGGSPISPIIARLLLNDLGLGQQPVSGPAAGYEAGKMDKNTNQPPVNLLSDREVEALNLLSRGFTYAECADLLEISPHTIGTHVKNIYRKLEVTSRAEAVFEASSLGILGPH